MFSEKCLTLAESKLVKVSLFLIVTVLSNCINIVTWGDHIVNCIAYSDSCKRDIDNLHRIIIASLKLHCIALSLLSPLLKYMHLSPFLSLSTKQSAWVLGDRMSTDTQAHLLLPIALFIMTVG